MRFFIHTLGCKINQYESQAVREAWTARGMIETMDVREADVVLAHTCAVTAGAVADSRGAVRRAGREAPGARIVVAGCAAQIDPGAFAGLPGVARVVPRQDKPGLAFRPDCPENAGTHAPPAWPDFAVTGFHRARAILKIQDGCSHGCSYCIVPRARGRAVSRPYAQILAEALRLIHSGHKEIVLSGVNLGQFTLEKGDFWDMLTRLDSDLSPQWAGKMRLRLSSLDPGMLGPKALAALSSCRLVCPHLHLSLQSADAGVLAAMGRAHYTPQGILDFLDALRGIWPIMSLGTDILTGFPGESESAFRATFDFMRRAGLSYAHVFPYSRRPGTAAATRADQTPRPLRKERAALLRREASLLEHDFTAELTCLPRLTMAVERQTPGIGVCEYYTEVRLEGSSPILPGGLLEVRPAGIADFAVLAKPASL